MPDDPRLAELTADLTPDEHARLLERIGNAVMVFTVDCKGAGELTRVPDLHPADCVDMLRSMADQMEAKEAAR